jgi:hypothetical protein
MSPQPHGAFQPRDPTPRGDPETSSSTPSGYPFEMKAAAVSLPVAGEWAAPVVVGLGTGADAPKSLMRFRGYVGAKANPPAVLLL